MKTVIEEKVTAPTVSDERKEELRDGLLVLDEQERTAMETLSEMQAELARIQEERRVLMRELLDGDSAQPDALELTLEMANEAITALKAEFDKAAEGAQQAGYVVQKGMDFAAVEVKLRAEESGEKLKAVYRMVKAGSRPAVVCEEDGRFCIAETFGQTLSDRANCVYDRKAEKEVGRENCNGNAVAQSQKMGVPLMETRIAKAYMAKFPDRNQYCSDYIQATSEEREDGDAPYVFRGDGGANVFVCRAHRHYGYLGWRGALWV